MRFLKLAAAFAETHHGFDRVFQLGPTSDFELELLPPVGVVSALDGDATLGPVPLFDF